MRDRRNVRLEPEPPVIAEQLALGCKGEGNKTILVGPPNLTPYEIELLRKRSIERSQTEAKCPYAAPCSVFASLPLRPRRRTPARLSRAGFGTVTPAR